MQSNLYVHTKYENIEEIYLYPIWEFFTFVDDAVEATMLAANNDVVGEVFNVGGGSRISVNDLIERMEDIIEKKAKVKYIEKQKGDVRDTLADVSKAKKELG